MDLSTREFTKFYDFFGEKYDWFSIYEANAKKKAIEWLALSPGLRMLDIGTGSGKEHGKMHEAIQPEGKLFGVDLSKGMLHATQKKGFCQLIQANALQLPFSGSIFDRIYCAYLLDLLPQEFLPEVLTGFSKSLKPGGRMVLLSLTEGIDLPSRMIVALWKQVYKVSATACGGCRPLALDIFAQKAGLNILHKETIVQSGIPSRIVVIQQ